MGGARVAASAKGCWPDGCLDCGCCWLNLLLTHPCTMCACTCTQGMWLQALRQASASAFADTIAHGTMGERGTWASDDMAACPMPPLQLHSFAAPGQVAEAMLRPGCDRTLGAATSPHAMPAAGAAAYVLTASELMPVRSSAEARGLGSPAGATCESTGRCIQRGRVRPI